MPVQFRLYMFMLSIDVNSNDDTGQEPDRHPAGMKPE